jgi:hypothetical protein
MIFVKQIGLGLALIFALAVPALAQGYPQAINIGEGTMLMVTPKGEVMTVQTPPTMSDTMMKEGKKITAGMMIMRRGGDLYLVPDKKMADGRMMSDMVMKH